MKREKVSKGKNRFSDHFYGEVFQKPIMHNHGEPLDETEYIRLSHSLKNVIDKMEKQDKKND